jgi:hypoxanthine phosphoribosyltransferase
MTLQLSWEEVTDAAKNLASDLIKDQNIDEFIVLAPPFGGWPVASLIINQIRNEANRKEYKPPVIIESDLTRHLLIPILSSGKKIIIFDDVLDTGKVINNIIWRIVHECRTFVDESKILDNIIICTIGKKRDCSWARCKHYYQYVWAIDKWIQYPWE